jgi:hypothetical protein
MNLARKIDPDDSEITTTDGASARISRHGDAEVITVHDRVGRVLFQYDATTGRGMLVMPEGDLRIAAPKGSIELVASGEIRAKAGGDLSLSSAAAANIVSSALHVEAKESDLSLGDANARADSLRAAVDRAELKYGSLVRSAERVIEQAENLYQRVSELCEVKAGRLRALVRGGVWMKGEDLTLVAQKDVRIDGEHINLG